jgi:hypothetical protein
VSCNGHAEARPTPPPAPSTTEHPLSADELALSGPWQAALAGDGLAYRRLAELHPAVDLLAVARGDRARAPAAFAALDHARDVELVLGTLAEMALSGEHRSAALGVIQAAAARPLRAGEALDPHSLRRCIEALDRLSRDEQAARADRARAVSALRALARAGYLDERRITTALDPREP